MQVREEPQIKFGRKSHDMDYRKDMGTPRERVDDELLRRLLREADEMSAECGCSPSRSQENGSSRCRDRSSSDGREQRNPRESGGCGCINERALSYRTQGLPLVMSYAPDQDFHELYEAEEALETGTLFKELNFPFYPVACGNGRSCGCNSVQ